MERTVAIGIQNFGDLIQKKYFYIDKTSFIKEWRESGDSVTLITRPRRFGKEANFTITSYRIRQLLMKQYEKNSFLLTSGCLSNAEQLYFERMAADMSEADAPLALYQLSDYLFRYYGKKVIILLDEYDTPTQEAYVDGYWNELVALTMILSLLTAYILCLR